MGLHRNTAIRHLSYQQLEEMLRSLGEQIKSNEPQASLCAVDNDNQAITWMLSDITGLPVLSHNPKALKFGLTSELDTDICLFKKNYNSEHYNRTVKHYVEDLYQEEDESFTRITLPWRK